MNKAQFIKELKEIESLALVLEAKAGDLRKEAAKQIEKLAGVSTPAVRKGYREIMAKALAKREKYYAKPTNK